MLFGILNININQSVKRVQRRATKLLMETRHITCTQRLEYLEWPSLWYRRLKGGTLHTFEIISGIDDMNCEKFLNLLIMIVLEILIVNYIFYMLKHRVRNVHLVEYLHLFGMLNCHI